MSEFSARVRRIREPVVDHPNADRLSIIRIDGYDCISAKLADGSHRYQEGDHVAYIPECSVLPEWLLKRLDMWNDEENKGSLAGPKGNCVKAMKLRGIFSQGVLYPVKHSRDPFSFTYSIEVAGEDQIIAAATYWDAHSTAGGDPDGMDVSTMLGITKYEPPIPVNMAGELCSVGGATMKYDFENLNSVPKLFRDGELVVATEKLHGTHAQIAYVPGLALPELSGGGNLFIGSKGLSAQGLVMRAGEANAGNLYSQTLCALEADGFAERIADLATEAGCTVHVFGEIFGGGVQGRYDYGSRTPLFRAFDIALNRLFVGDDDFVTLCARLRLVTPPTLYRGPFDRVALEAHRDGKTMLGGQHIREGLVVKTVGGSDPLHHGRKVAKMVSPAYLLKTDGSEVA